MTRDEQAAIWASPYFNPPGLLVGPLPKKRSPGGCWAPDYSHPGVAERVALEVEFIEDIICGQTRRSF